MTAEILHRLPAEGQVIPTPRSGERVVFVSHFLRGLGFALNPFVRGLMFYYGLDFHDLAPNFTQHFGVYRRVRGLPPHQAPLRLMVKPKVVGGRQAECGGAMLGKMPNVTWLEGTFVETVKGWQSG